MALKPAEVNADIAARIVADCPAKLTECLRILRTLIGEGRKAAVFCSFVAPLMALRTLMENEFGVGCAPVLDGSLTGAARAAIVGRPNGIFFSEPKCRVLLATYSAGGVGLNLAPAADAVVLLDTWWNPAVHQQAIDRIHRIGAVRPCSVYVLQHHGSFDTACSKLYHSFKERNGHTIMRGTYTEGESIVFGEGAAYSLLGYVAVELGLKDVADKMQELTGMKRLAAGDAEALAIAGMGKRTKTASSAAVLAAVRASTAAVAAASKARATAVVAASKALAAASPLAMAAASTARAAAANVRASAAEARAAAANGVTPKPPTSSSEKTTSEYAAMVKAVIAYRQSQSRYPK